MSKKMTAYDMLEEIRNQAGHLVRLYDSLSETVGDDTTIMLLAIRPNINRMQSLAALLEQHEKSGIASLEYRIVPD